MTIRTTIKMLMTKHNVSSNFLAKEIGCSPATLHRFFSENKNINFSYFMSILDYFEFPMEKLLKNFAYDHQDVENIDTEILNSISNLPSYKKEIYLTSIRKASIKTKRTPANGN